MHTCPSQCEFACQISIILPFWASGLRQDASSCTTWSHTALPRGISQTQKGSCAQRHACEGSSGWSSCLREQLDTYITHCLITLIEVDLS